MRGTHHSHSKGGQFLASIPDSGSNGLEGWVLNCFLRAPICAGAFTKMDKSLFLLIPFDTQGLGPPVRVRV